MESPQVHEPQRVRQRALLELLQLLGLAWCVRSLLTITVDESGRLNLLTGLAVIGVVIVVGSLLTQTVPWWTERVARAKAQGLELHLLVLASGLGGIAAMRQYLQLDLVEAEPATPALLWGMACAMLVVAVWPGSLATLRAWAARYRMELLGVGLLTLTGGALRLYQLSTLPSVLTPAEGAVGMAARQVGGMAMAPMFATIDGAGVLYLRLVDRLVALFGAGAVSLRLLPALAGTLAIPATYLLARHLLGRRAAILAAVALLVSHAHLLASRNAEGVAIYATLFIPLTIYGLLTGLEQHSTWRMVLSAILLGLYVAITSQAWLWVLLCVVGMLVGFVLVRPLYQGNAPQLRIFALVLAVVLAPFALWAQAFPEAFLAPLRVQSSTGTGWLAHEVAATGKSELAIILMRGQAILQSVLLVPMHNERGGASPLLDLFSGMLWLLGLIIAVLKRWSHHLLLLNLWFWGSVLGLAALSTPQSTPQHMLVLLPPACLLIGLAGDWAMSLLDRLSPGQQVSHHLGAIVVIALLLLNIGYRNFLIASDMWHAPCAPGSVAGAREASLLGGYLQQIPPDSVVYLLSQGMGAGYNYGESPVLEFLSAGAIPTTIYEPVTEVVVSQAQADSAAMGTRHIVFVAHSSRAGELVALPQWLPRGQEYVLSDCGAEVFRTYVVAL